MNLPEDTSQKVLKTMNPEIACVDTNIFVRLFTQDDPSQFQAAQSLFQSCQNGEIQIVLNDLIMIEIGWVLGRSYKLSSVQIRKYLLSILNMDFVDLRPADVTYHFPEAMNLFTTKNISLADAYLATWMKQQKIPIMYTFDTKHFQRIAGIIIKIPR